MILREHKTSAFQNQNALLSVFFLPGSKGEEDHVQEGTQGEEDVFLER